MKSTLLDMRMSSQHIRYNANFVLRTYTEDRLGKIIKEYGEEHYYKVIAKAICEYRKVNRLKTTD